MHIRPALSVIRSSRSWARRGSSAAAASGREVVVDLPVSCPGGLGWSGLPRAGGDFSASSTGAWISGFSRVGRSGKQ